MIKKIIGTVLLTVAIVFNSFAADISGETTLFEGARLITGHGGPPIESSAFLVKNGKFTHVGKKGELRYPVGAKRIDLSGKTVIPGLIDTHTHIGYDRYSHVISKWAQIDPSGRGLFNWGPQNFTRDNILDHMSRLAYAGVAAVWSAGYEFGEIPYKIRDEILAGQHPNAARYYPAGPGITTREAIIPDYGRQSAFGVSSEAEARAAVQRLADWKVTQIKLWPNSNPAMSPLVYRAVIDEARKHNMRVGFHPTNLEDAQEMIRGGAIMLHPYFELDDGLVKEFTTYSALTSAGGRVEFYAPYLHPSDPLLAEMIAPIHLKSMQKRFPNPKREVREKRKADWEKQVAIVKKLRAAGVQFTMGSDAGGAGRDKPVGWTTHVDMENMVAAGFTPAEVIVAATKTAADSLRLEDLGLIAPGKEAAFMVLDANPLNDITNTRKINKVYLRGKEVDRAGLRAEWRKSWPSGS
ncbi:amidohydrolase family protein [Aliikangiella coralliicola]|uniref:Amidohydrolase family protein n=1 Tax=Aliikangiella coralliicola TaxID=2592383 RepID=A0A545U8Y0_9GAMM|nr:amidohydrolase family protein [Aliikangiella coralliicola]TQV85919.1 amidohydrolase family protein [Aliikangiella coralliicola]